MFNFDLRLRSQSSKNSTLAAVLPDAPPEFTALNIPWVSGLDDPAGRIGIAANYTPPEASVTVWYDSEIAIGAAPSASEIGSLLSPLPAGPLSRWDHAASVDARLSGLSASDRVNVLNGSNRLIVEHSNFDCEVIQFVNCVSLGGDDYRLSEILRGVRGEYSGDAPEIPAGHRVIKPSDYVLSSSLSVAGIGSNFDWYAGPPSQGIGGALTSTDNKDYTGRATRPLSPVYLRNLRNALTQDLTLIWARRDRSPLADSWGADEIPLSETIEQYEVEIMTVGDVVVRSVTVNASEYLYSVADRVSDGTDPSFKWRVRQMSGAGVAGDWSTFSIVGV